MRKHFAARAVIILVLLGSLTASGATLGIDGKQAVVGNDRITVAIGLKPGSGESVASFQLDVRFDPDRLVLAGVETGKRAAEAGKTAHANPLRPGQLRVVVAGFNSNVIGDGEVLRLIFNRSAPSIGETTVRIERGIISDPFGSAVPVALSPDLLMTSRDTAGAVAMDSGMTAQHPNGVSALSRYRAIFFALVVVAFTMLLARSGTKKKGRAR